MGSNMSTIVVGIRCGFCGYEPRLEENIIPGNGDKCPKCNFPDMWFKIGALTK